MREVVVCDFDAWASGRGDGEWAAVDVDVDGMCGSECGSGRRRRRRSDGKPVEVGGVGSTFRDELCGAGVGVGVGVGVDGGVCGHCGLAREMLI